MAATYQRVAERDRHTFADRWIRADQAETRESPPQRDAFNLRGECCFSCLLLGLSLLRREQAVSTRPCGGSRFRALLLLRVAGQSRAVGCRRTGSRNLDDLPWTKRASRASSKSGQVVLANLALRFGHWGAGLSDAVPNLRSTRGSEPLASGATRLEMTNLSSQRCQLSPNRPGDSCKLTERRLDLDPR